MFQKKFEKTIGNKIVTTNIHRIKAYNSIMSGYFCIGLTDFMRKGKSFLVYANLFSFKKY